MRPLTISLFSNAVSRRSQVRARLAFSRDRRVSPEPSSTLSSATSTSSPTLTSISPRSFLNCSSRDHGLGLEAGAHDDHVGVDVDHAAGEDLARAESAGSPGSLRTVGQSFRSCLVTSRGLATRIPAGILPARVDENAPASCAALRTSAHHIGSQGSALLARARTRSTTSSTAIPVESMTTASGAGRSGATGRVESRRSRSRISCERPARLAASPFSFNCL